MIVYRITLPQYANDLSGIGAALYGGRWNSVGNFMLYSAQTSSLSMLEHLVHITGSSSVEYTLTRIDLGNSQIKDLEPNLPLNWDKNEKISSSIGDDWVKGKSTPILKVPSVINPLESNFLINPNHPHLQMKTVSHEWFVYDHRLIKK